MLTIFRRHSPTCHHRSKGRSYRNCRCPIHVQGTLEGQHIREALKTRVWSRAQYIVREWEASGSKNDRPVAISSACTAFLDDCRDRGLAESSIVTYGKLTRRLEVFCELHGLKSLKHLTTDHLSQFRSTWSKGNWSSLKRWEQLRTLCKFWLSRGWLVTDPSAGLKRPLAKANPTMPFSREEIASILSAIESYPIDHHDKSNRDRLRAFVLTLRYTGFRMSDAWSLNVDKIKDGKVMLYTAKTGTPVWLPLPPRLISALATIRPNSAGYYFWSGTSNSHAAFNSWNRKLVRLFRLANIENGHAHRFRDTFAVEMLLAGVPIERVSIMLGHQSIRVTERHYSPWVRARQDQLEEDVRRVWGEG